MSRKKSQPAKDSGPALAADGGLDRETRMDLLRLILESRHGDLRQESLNRQGKGHFHVSGMGHEALGALGRMLREDDYVCPYYRDRALVMGKGVTTRELALDYFAKRASGSRGRQMPGHYSVIARKIWSVPTPTAAQLLPACGIAWGMQLDGKDDLVVTSIGEASTRQGDFYEAITFAFERKLPVLFVVEDNEYGISTPTTDITPLAIGTLNTAQWEFVDGSDAEATHEACRKAIERIRAGEGPACLWMKMARLSSHTSSDDHKIYRPAEDIARLAERDPLLILRDRMIADGQLTADEFTKLDALVKEDVREAYLVAEKAEDPVASELESNVVDAAPVVDEQIFKAGKYRIGDIMNLTLRAGLDADPRRIIFGEDVEDPKGGVFKMTKQLSTDFPEQVFNSPLAESTILGVACGLASYGKRPIFEIQFIDFIYPGWNQLVTNLATLRWRSFGGWKCPCVIYAPYGAYLPGGSLWHSQANEAAIAHFPGINIVIPSTPEDTAGLLWSAMHAEDPVVFLVPKHLLWAEREVKEPLISIPIGTARKRRGGSDVTLVGWGNTIELSLDAIDQLGSEIDVELIDLRSIVPWDREMIEDSVRKTGRLVVVQEDTENCSVGQMIISHICGRPDVFSRLVAPPVLVTKGNVMIGYNPIYEYAALPNAAGVVDALRRTMASTMSRAFGGAAAQTSRPAAVTSEAEDAPSAQTSGGNARSSQVVEHIIKVPIMGEGIRTARVVALLKKPGDVVKHDDALCEVETEKAVYPIESPISGTFVGWKVAVDDTVLIGQEIGVLAPTGIDASAMPVDTPEPAKKAPAAPAPAQQSIDSSGAPAGSVRVEPALSPAITRRLEQVIPATLESKALWAPIRDARAVAKERDATGAPSPSVMVAWAVTRAMEKHGTFRRLGLKDGSIVEVTDFELGMAVALPGDKLATAVVANANRLSWPEFVRECARAVDVARSGKLIEHRAPVVITSLGNFGVRGGIPIVVPPSVGTLFVGTSFHEMIRSGNSAKLSEVVTFCLTFDHRIVNGAGGAAFLRDVCREVEGFKLPE
ncbi:MAG TPA: thiamine pyrophosphate-dependent enzyme [Opitutaceae bacterium]|nr:thiamine pyrophosphate-dependent enzyme [Opitutaceae bacterium]